MDTFRDELAKRYPKHGHALWDPDPGGLYDAVQVGDVGFIREGYFCRLFNALHPDRQPPEPNAPLEPDNPPSLDRSSNPEPRVIPEYPPRLQPNTPHIRKCRENQRDFCSKNITKESHQPGGNTHALGPDDDGQVTVTCSGKQGTLLSLPFPAEREDTVARGVFGEWIVKNIHHCVRIAEARGLGLHRTEDIILVTGRHLARSWINVAFSETRGGAQVCFGIRVSGTSGVHLEGLSISGGELNLGPSGEDLPKNQCIFIRGWRVVRFLNIWPRLRAMAEPAPDMHDPEPESDTRLEFMGEPADAEYQDPLHVLLEYIAEQAPDCDMALVHDDDLGCIDVAETALQPGSLIGHFRDHAPAIRRFQCELPGNGGGSGAEVAIATVATLSNVAFEAPHEDGAISTFQTTSTEDEYLTGERECGPPVTVEGIRQPSSHPTPSAAGPSPGTLAPSPPAPQSPLPSQKVSTAATPPAAYPSMSVLQQRPTVALPLTGEAISPPPTERAQRQLHAFPMSQSARTSADPSATIFSSIFEVALVEYKDKTGKDLRTHPFALSLQIQDSPDDILRIFRNQADDFDTFRENDKLMASLKPIVDVLFTLSETISGALGLVGFSPAKAIFAGIGLLIGVVRDEVASYEKLVGLFERVHFFLQRLNRYTGVPLSLDMVEPLGKIMAQVLSILALSTNMMNEGLMGRSNLDDAFQRLDMLTKEEDLMTVARNLELTHQVSVDVQAIRELAQRVDNKVSTIPEAMQGVDDDVKSTEVIHDVRDNVKVFQEDVRDVNDSLRLTRRKIEGEIRNQPRESLRMWLAPPDPSINHSTACNIRHKGTVSWFLQGKLFSEWKERGVLWVCGIPGAGKTVLCSAVIEDIKHMRVARSALIAYYYFDVMNAAKRDVRGLLASILMQLVHDSKSCSDVLSKLYRTCRDGLEQPSDAALSQSLKDMLELPEQLPIFLIVDALDECPNDYGTPSARERVLDFLNDLVESNHSNLHICITSRPEQDIQSILDPLIPPSRRISLHEEPGQKKDINEFIHSFVHHGEGTQKWRETEKGLVMNKLSQRAGGMFRWVSHQVDTLDRCFPSSVRKALDELPPTLEDTYERTLQGIDIQKRKHARRLFKCMIAAARPLRVEELAEILAVDFDEYAAGNLVECWRPENPEEAVLSTCSTLVSIVDEEGAKILQFSHSSVKEFLTTRRLETSEIGNTSRYYVPLEQAHMTLAQSCLAVLMQLDENVDKRRLAKLPLALYAARHWVDHARFGSVALQIRDAMEYLFRPEKPYLQAWVWIHDIEKEYKRPGTLNEHPSPLTATPLYYAAFFGFDNLAMHLIFAHIEDLNAECGLLGTPLHAASYRGCVAAAGVLLGHGADANSTNRYGESVLFAACAGKHIKVARLLLEHGADVNVTKKNGKSPLHGASESGGADIVRLLLQHNADRNAQDFGNRTPLHLASKFGHLEVAQLLLEHGADVDLKNNNGESPLFAACAGDHLEVVRLLLQRGANVELSSNDHSRPLHRASERGGTEVARLLLGHNADVNARDVGNWTPLHIASEFGHLEVTQLLLGNHANPNAQCNSRNTPLRRASEDGHLEMARLLLAHGADVNIRGYRDLTPFQAATEYGHHDIAELLLEHGAERD